MGEVVDIRTKRRRGGGGAEPPGRHGPTEGPWRAICSPHGLWVEPPAGGNGSAPVAELHGPDAEANGHLVAAAPDLLRLARIAMEALELDPLPLHIRVRLRRQLQLALERAMGGRRGEHADGGF